MKLVLKFMEIEVKSIRKKINLSDRIEINIAQHEDGSGVGYWYYLKNDYFKNLEDGTVYTLKELRIGGLNGRI